MDTKKENRYFSHKELSCSASGVVLLAHGFLDDLIGLRKEYDKPMKVNSCCRSKAYNKHERGHPRSLHVYDNPYHPTGGACAIDIAMTDSQDRAKLIRIALTRGWSVGVAKAFVHLDRRNIADLSQVLYHY